MLTRCSLQTDLGGVHDDSGDEVEEDVVAVGADGGVAEGHLQLVHGLQQQPLPFILQILERGLLQIHEDAFTSYTLPQIAGSMP